MTDPLIALIESEALTFRAALERAHEIGRAAGYTEAEAAFRDKLVTVFKIERPAAPTLGAKTLDTSNPVIPNAAPDETEEPDDGNNPEQRAERGSVRPAILEALKTSDRPMRPNDIFEAVRAAGHTLIKSESIRSSLHKMQADKLLYRDGLGWRAVAPGSSRLAN